MTYSSAAARRVVAIAAAAAVAGLAAAAAALAATSAPAAHAAAAIPRCSAGPDGLGLAAWVAIDQGNGAAGTVYYPLELTNTSGHACSLYGFPGVSATSRSGGQLGSPAGWQSGPGFGTKHAVVLAPGATAHAILAYHDAVVSTAPGCDPVDATFELRVFPPGAYHATHALFDLDACSHAGPVYMNVGPVLPGLGTIDG